jgi:iron complex outermembrane receptor protein
MQTNGVAEGDIWWIAKHGTSRARPDQAWPAKSPSSNTKQFSLCMPSGVEEIIVLPSAMALAALFFFCHHLLASDIPSSSSDIPNIIVSATRSAQTEQLTPGRIEIIDRSQIEATGASHLVDLLRSIGTTQVQDNYGDGSRATIGLRGFGATAGSNTLIMIDGRRLNNTDLAPPELNSIALKDVQRIEIIQGSSGVLFGDQAIGGVVNIITKITGDSDIDLEVGLTSYAGRQLQAAVTHQFDGGLRVRLTGEKRRSDGYRDRNDLDLTNIFANVGYEYDSGSLFIEHQTIQEDLRLPGALTRDQVVQSRKQAQFATDFVNTDTDITRAGVNQRITPHWSLLAEITSRQSDADGMLSGGTPFQQEREMIGFNPRLIGQYETFMVTLGTDIESNEYQLASNFGGFIATTTNDQKVTSEYIQLVYPLNSVASTTVGVRHAEVENEIVDTFTFPGGARFDDSETVYEIGISYSPNQQTRLFLRRAGSYRFPKTDELTFTGINLVQLETQTGVSLELGIDWQGTATQLGAMLYSLTLEDEIGFDPLADIGFGFFGANNNLDDTERKGITLSIDWQLADNLSLSSRADYIDSEFTDGAFEGQRIPFVSRHLANLGVTFTPRPGWSLFLEAQYAGDRYADGDFGNTEGSQGGYTVFNGNVRYVNDNWAVSFRADNLTDKRYSEYTALRFDGVKTFYPSPERRYHIHFSYSF